MPIGAVLQTRPDGVPCVRMPGGSGWRRVVASPRPIRVIEQSAIAALLSTHHVIAGGGGGVPLSVSDGTRRPQAAVVDKDWVAALLAISLHADKLLFVTDVPYVFDRFGKFPGTVPSLFCLTYLQAHHLDLAFYDEHFQPGAYLRTHAEHQERWH